MFLFLLLNVCVLCLAGQRQARYLEWMSKYRIRTLQEKREGGFTELPEGRVSVCVCVRAVKICRALKSLHSVQSGECVLLSSVLKGVILLNSTGQLQIRSVRLSRKSSSKETSKN